MIITITGSAGQAISLDLRKYFGDLLEIECFQFAVPPLEFRLVRNGVPLADWQPGNTEMYDLQHPPRAKEWSRDGHQFINDLQHRNDVLTCGVLSQDLAVQTRGLAFPITLLVWLRESTCRTKPSATAQLPMIRAQALSKEQIR